MISSAITVCFETDVVPHTMKEEINELSNEKTVLVSFYAQLRKMHVNSIVQCTLVSDRNACGRRGFPFSNACCAAGTQKAHSSRA